MAGSVQLLADIEDAGQEAFVIQTPSARYVYHKEGGGFRRLIDRDERDWIGYGPGGGPAGEYRGIPNMVFRGDQGGFFHPGHTGTRASSTELLGDEPEAVSLLTTSCNDRWQVRWDIFATYARMTVLRVDAEDPEYWLLYEGTPGGGFDPDRSLCLRSSGESTPLTEPWETELPDPNWVGFTDPDRENCLVLRCRLSEACPAMYKAMEPMTVFGFGRELRGVSSFLRDAGSRLCVGLVKGATHESIGTAVQEWK
jgi:hypothetical protein